MYCLQRNVTHLERRAFLLHLDDVGPLPLLLRLELHPQRARGLGLGLGAPLDVVDGLAREVLRLDTGEDIDVRVAPDVMVGRLEPARALDEIAVHPLDLRVVELRDAQREVRVAVRVELRPVHPLVVDLRRERHQRRHPGGHHQQR